MDERRAIVRMQQGDIGGLEVLVQRHQARALDAAVLVCRDAALAEDIVQAAFLRAYERSRQIDPTRPFAPWFLRVVVNDAVKAASRRRSVPLDAIVPPLTERIGPNPTPYEALEAAETRVALRAAIDRLSPAQRAAVVLRYYLDLSDAEVVHHLALPPGTIRRRLQDARQRLRVLLPPWLGGGGGDAPAAPPERRPR